MSVGNKVQNVLVTGARGFIGVNLVRKLLSKGINIRAIDNLSLLPDDPTRNGLFNENDPFVWRTGAYLVKADIRDAKIVKHACKGADALIHLAANSGVQQSLDDPEADMDCNIRGTLSCLNAAREAKVSTFIFASSGAPLGLTQPPVDENSLPRPISPYGVSKLTGEAYCSAYTHSFGMNCIALRFANVYGPFSSHKTSVVGQFLSQAIAGKPWQIYGDGTQTRDFIHVSDLVNAISAALSTDDIFGEIFHIASGIEIPIIEMANKIALLLKQAGLIPPKIIFEATRSGDMQRSRANIAKATELLSWSPTIALQDGLAETVAWFMAERT